MMIVPGGFGRSAYLLARLRAQYPKISLQGQATDLVGEWHNVSRGALLRYQSIEERELISTGSFDIGQIEICDVKLLQHQDAVIYPNFTRKPMPVVDQQMANVDPDLKDNGQVVWNLYDRWACLLLKGKTYNPGHVVTSGRYQQAVIYPGDTTFSQQIWWTELDIADHDRILTLSSGKKGALEEGAEPRNGIEPWGEALVFTLPNLEEMGFDLRPNRKGELVYEILYQLTLICNRVNMEVRLRIAKPGSRVYDLEEATDIDPADVDLEDWGIHEIMAHTHNPNARTDPS
ncbi:hypothetical protein LTR27_001565 [Elasticomyces elasticus]|nr:hypothetical protein LTR27_001565 [Elasticomyces elasticus]